MGGDKGYIVKNTRHPPFFDGGVGAKIVTIVNTSILAGMTFFFPQLISQLKRWNSREKI